MKFCNINFDILKKDEIFLIADGETKCIATVNAQFIVLANKNERYMNYINSNHATFDGEIPLRFAKKHSSDFRSAQKLSGSDIVYDFCEFARDKNLRMFFLGGYEDSNAQAVKKIKDTYGIAIEGFSPPRENYPFSKEFEDGCKEKILNFRPDIIFVGFGAPKQEFFIEDNFEFFKSIGVKFAVGSGGTFEFVSGKISRAPRFVQKLGLESLWRLASELSVARLKRIFYSFKFFKYINRKPDWESKKAKINGGIL